MLTTIDTAVEPEAPPVPKTQRGDNRDRLKHVVMDRDKTREAILMRTPVTALCGKTWVPSRWSPSDAMRCLVCDELARAIYFRPPGSD